MKENDVNGKSFRKGYIDNGIAKFIQREKFPL